MILLVILEDDSASQKKLEYIFNSYGKQMLFTAKKVAGNTQDAEDAVQDALIRIASNLDSVDTADPVKARNYVLIAAKNAAVNILRKKGRSPQTVDLDDEQFAGREDTESVVAENDSLRRITDCIKELDEKYRHVLYLRFVEEMSEKKIAALLGRKYSTVKMQVKRGRAKLIELLEERGIAVNDERRNGDEQRRNS